MPTRKGRVYFHSLKPFSFFKDRKKLKTFIEKIFRKEKKMLIELHYIFCPDDYLLKINQQFLHHNYYTDIITFDLSGNNGLSGEIYISIDRLIENAEKYKTPYSNELYRLVFHGALHLCGYKDKTIREKKLMRDKEDFYLMLYSKIC